MAPTADAWRVVSSFEVVQMTAGRALGAAAGTPPPADDRSAGLTGVDRPTPVVPVEARLDAARS